MKAVILAAGEGKRMHPLTYTRPKVMLPIANMPIMEHLLIEMKAAGINDFIFVVGYHGETIREHFGDGSKWDVRITYSYDKEILGTSGAVRKIVEDFGKNLWDNNFLVVYGDNYFPLSFDVTSLIDFHFRRRAEATIGLFDKFEEVPKSGVVMLNEDNRVTCFVEKPDLKDDSVTYSLINSGLYTLNKRIIDYIPSGFSDFGRDIFPELLVRGVPIYGYEFGEPVIAIDTIKAYEKVVKG